MTHHALTDERRSRAPMRSSRENPLFQLGWPHFWLFVAILGGSLALVALVFFAASMPV
jgi:hypothetical protein